MDAPPVPVPFRIDTTSTPAVVEVDGTDIADRVRGVTVRLGYQAPTVVTLELERPGALEGTGIVAVAGGSPIDLLRALDPDAVEAATMARDLDDGTMAGHYIDTIAAMWEAGT